MHINFSFLVIIVIPIIIVFGLLYVFFFWYIKTNKQIRIQQLMLETMLKLVEQNGANVNWDEVNEILGKKKH